jgi:hypothetical protein
MVSVASQQPSRQGYRSGVVCVGPGVLPAKPGEVQPAFFQIGELVASKEIRTAAFGLSAIWLDVAASYAKPGAASPYRLSLAVRIGGDGVEKIFPRSCSCPDAAHRLEAGAAPGSEAAQCKHLVALAAEMQSEEFGSRHPLWAAFIAAVCAPEPQQVPFVRLAA